MYYACSKVNEIITSDGKCEVCKVCEVADNSKTSCLPQSDQLQCMLNVCDWSKQILN